MAEGEAAVLAAMAARKPLLVMARTVAVVVALFFPVPMADPLLTTGAQAAICAVVAEEATGTMARSGAAPAAVVVVVVATTAARFLDSETAETGLMAVGVAAPSTMVALAVTAAEEDHPEVMATAGMEALAGEEDPVISDSLAALGRAEGGSGRAMPTKPMAVEATRSAELFSAPLALL
jgi:hypothetical protein